MQQFLSSMRNSVSSQNWFSALFMTLAMPDICAALEHGRTTGERYENWFDRYLKATYSPTQRKTYEIYQGHLDSGVAPELEMFFRTEIDRLKAREAADTGPKLEFTASDCYQFRCKCLHQGLSERAGKQKIEFSPPPQTGLTIHKTLINGTYIIAIDIFCEDMCQAIEQWLIDKADDTTIQQRISELMNLDNSFVSFLLFNSTGDALGVWSRRMGV